MTWMLSEAALPNSDGDVLSTLFCVGNGRSCTRGTLPEERGGFRGVYLSGLYTKAGYGLVYFMGGPDWLPLFLQAEGERLPCVRSARVLDMREGVLLRTAEFATEGARVEVREERFTSLAQPNVVAQRCEVRVLAAGTPVELVLGLDGDVRNHRAKYYKPGQLPNSDARGLRLSSIEHLEATREHLQVVLFSRTAGRRAAATAWVRQTAGRPLEPAYATADSLAAATFRLPEDAQAGEVFVFEKTGVLTADLEGIEEARQDAARLQTRFREQGYAKLRQEHAAAWAEFWKAADVEIEGDPEAQRALRFALWSTRLAAPDDGGASSLGAKNLTGDWYRGAVFWDLEMFQLPLLAALSPRHARNHLRYRARRLPAARILAAQDGYQGARYPWQSYASGLEEPPAIGGFLYQQQHLNAAVGWGVLHTYYLTGDQRLMFECGFELLVELCRFWASRADGPDGAGRCHIRNVCGPDEIHQGVDDNAYTNRMVAHLLDETVRLVGAFRADVTVPAQAPGPDAGRTVSERLQGLLVRFGLKENELARWSDLARRLYIPQLPSGVPAQFEGFAGYPEPDERLNSGSVVAKDKTNKQADTLLLFQALPGAFGREVQERAYREYAPLCNQTSSLSLCTHALVATRLGRTRDAERYFRAAAGVDLRDQLGNTCHGIHAAGEGGLWLATVHGFGGLQAGPAGVALQPQLPPFWKALRYRFLLEGQLVEVCVLPDSFEVKNQGERGVRLHIGGAAVVLPPRQARRFPCVPAWQAPRLEGVIFDLDGVLVSTDRFHYLAWKELADDLKLAFDEEVNHRLRGVSRGESLELIYAHNGRELPAKEVLAEQCARKNASYLELVEKMTAQDVLPGAAELLAGLRGAGVKVAIASASRNAPLVLERTGLTRLVDAIADGRHTTAGKPDPQVFFLAAQRLRCLPWNCIGVEDAATGIEAIHRAGMLALGVGPAAAGADLTVRDVGAVSAESLGQLFRDKTNPTDPYYERNVRKMKQEMG